MARIILNTFGSFGDLHPYLAIGIELRARGHDAVIATSEVYRKKIEAEGLGFAPVRPDVGALLDYPKLIEKMWHPRRGTEYLIRDYLMPIVEESFEDLLAAAKGADLLVTHAAAYAGPTVAEVLNLRWMSIVLQPSIFLSTTDPPVLPEAWLRHVYRLGRPAIATLFALGRLRVRSWARPLIKLRRRLGLPTKANPVFEGQFSPWGTPALFSPWFAAPQPDWPAGVNVTGFVFYDRRGEGFGHLTKSADDQTESDLAHFLDSGPAPVVFTLGSSAVMQPGRFYLESLRAAERLGKRAVLLVGLAERAQFRAYSPSSIFMAEYAAYSQLMPRAAVNVHQGGIGTTAQALRAGRPMIVVPWSHDQPDNAERVRKLGVGRTINRAKYTHETVARELQIILGNPEYERRAAEIGSAIAAEQGLKNACDAIVAVLNGKNQAVQRGPQGNQVTRQ